MLSSLLKSIAAGALVLVGLTAAMPATAQSTDQAELEKLWNEIDALPWVQGPKDIAALEGATLALQQNYVFLDVASAPKLMELMGNPTDGTEREQVFAPDDLHWIGILEFSADGYVKDDEKIDADTLLESFRAGTEESNKIRREKGWAEMTITGWRRAPYYDAATNRLEWAIDANNSDGTSVINFNTRILGRRGVTSATLITDPEHFEADLADFRRTLEKYQFNPGERYSEFKEGDKIAAYGLGALVLGGAAAVAAKGGIFKALGKFIWVGILVAGGAIWAGIKRFFGGGARKVN